MSETQAKYRPEEENEGNKLSRYAYPPKEYTLAKNINDIKSIAFYYFTRNASNEKYEQKSETVQALLSEVYYILYPDLEQKSVHAAFDNVREAIYKHFCRINNLGLSKSMEAWLEMVNDLDLIESAFLESKDKQEKE